MTSQWPEHLVERIAAQDFVFVIGAGASAGCVNDQGASPLGWKDLLLSLGKKVVLDPNLQRDVNELIERLDYLNAAELIRFSANGSAKGTDLLKEIQKATDGPRNHTYGAGSLQQALLDLSPSIVVTTNYDRIWERASANGYALHSYYSMGLGRALRSGDPVLIKMHGGVDEIEKIILSRSDYASVRQQGAHAFDVLRALFMTRTALFVGYGFADPDLQLVLEDVVGTQGGPASHYWLIGDDLPSHMKEVYPQNYGVQPLFYKAHDYADCENRLKELVGLVQEHQLTQ